MVLIMDGRAAAKMQQFNMQKKMKDYSWVLWAIAIMLILLLL